MLFLLLQIYIFRAEVQIAANRPPAIPHPAIQLVYPDPAFPARIAWIPIEPHRSGFLDYPPVIYITEDFLRLAPPDLQGYVANHEVCHIRLGHHRLKWFIHEEMEGQVQHCLNRVYGARTPFINARYERFKEVVLAPTRWMLLK